MPCNSILEKIEGIDITMLPIEVALVSEIEDLWCTSVNEILRNRLNCVGHVLLVASSFLDKAVKVTKNLVYKRVNVGLHELSQKLFDEQVIIRWMCRQRELSLDILSQSDKVDLITNARLQI